MTTPELEAAGRLAAADRATESDDARVCRSIASAHARTFSMASRLLPERKRRGAFAIYATCRRADDLVDADAPMADGGRRLLSGFRTAAFRALKERSDDPILRELARAVAEFAVPVTALTEVFDGVESDLEQREYATWPDLVRYCEAVAGSVGEMTCAVFGISPSHARERDQAISCARTLGVAMQLTNILRDVGEDAGRGRCYLPSDELELHGLHPELIFAGTAARHRDAWRAFMRFQVARARSLYRDSLPGIALLERDAQRCALACASGYSKILDAMERSGFDTLSRRVSASRLTLLGVAWQSWRGQFPRFPADRAAELAGPVQHATQ